MEPWTELDPGFRPLSICEWDYRLAAERLGLPTDVYRFALRRSEDQVACQEVAAARAPELRPQTLDYLTQIVRSMLWIYGGWALYTDLPEDYLRELKERFSPSGPGGFDIGFIVRGIFGRDLEWISGPEVPTPSGGGQLAGRNQRGWRLGFDLGGSDQKIALLDPEDNVLFADSVVWDPYPQSSPAWHRLKLKELLRLGASKVPRVDSVGGSVPGVLLGNSVKVSALFRGVGEGVPERLFEEVVREEFGPVPFSLVNDGDAAALAGSILLKKKNLLGLAMGTSEAAGYIDGRGRVRPWFSELAFVPVAAGNAFRDEWSGIEGAGAQYFSQQAVIRLAREAGFSLPEGLSKADQLVWIQEKLESGDPRAEAVYRTVGRYLGYSLPWYHRFYRMENVLLLGRVLKGTGGSLIAAEAEKILEAVFPSLDLRIITLESEDVLHAQAVAAAFLPSSSGS